MANKYLHATSGTGNWTDATGTWTTTDQGATATTPPTTSDVAICTVNAGARTLTVNTNSCVAQQLNCNGFVGTLAIGASNQLSITTNITFGSGMTFTSSGKLRAGTGTATLNFAGVTVAGDFEFFGTGTKTLSANTTISGELLFSASPTVNGNTITCSALKSTSTSNRTLTGTTEINLIAGEWYRVTKTGGKILLNGNISADFLTGSYGGINNSTLEYVSGTFTVTGAIAIYGISTVKLGSSCHLDDINISGTTTLLDDIYVDGSMQGSGAVSNLSGAYTIYVGENLICYGNGTYISSDTKIVMNGTGIIYSRTNFNGMSLNPTTALQIDIDINTTGTITFPSTYPLSLSGDRTFKYVSGTLSGLSSCDFVVGGHNIDLTGTALSLSVVSGTCRLLKDFKVTTLTQTSGSTLNIDNTKTLEVTTNLTSMNTGTTTIASTSGTAILKYGGTEANIELVGATISNIDASSSAIKLYNWKGTVTNCTNIYAVDGDDIGGGGGFISITNF